MSSDKLQALDSIFAELFRESSPIWTNAESLPSTYPDQPSSDQPESRADAIDDPPDVGTLAERAKFVLNGLNLETGIRLRWALRDIKAKRTKMSPIKPNDLAALIDLGFVEMSEGSPRLTHAGDRVLD
jgi:hypothetical protein